MRALLQPLLPTLLLPAAAVLLVFSEPVRDALAPVAAAYALGVLIVVCVLGARFFRMAMVFGASALALVMLARFAPTDSLAEIGASIDSAWLIASFLLPLNLLFFAFVPERNLKSPLGMLRASMLPLQTILVISASREPWSETMASVLTQPLFPEMVSNALGDFGGISHPVLLMLLACLLALVVKAARQPGPLNIAWPTALLVASLALAPDVSETLAIWAAALGGTALAWGLVEHSFSMAYRDELTGLEARRALMESLRRVGGQWSVAMLDIDHFKSFNDTWGHDIGDRVLQHVATTMRSVGGGGRPYRYGGEEFTILFDDRDADGAFPFLEELREAIADLEIEVRPEAAAGGAKSRKRKKGKTTVSVTTSIGVATGGRIAESPMDVLKRADQALYKAKEGGRNQTAIFKEKRKRVRKAKTGERRKSATRR